MTLAHPIGDTEQDHDEIWQRLDEQERILEEHARRLRALELELGVYDAARDHEDER